MSVATGAGLPPVPGPGGAIRLALDSGRTSLSRTGSPFALIIATTTPLSSKPISEPQPRTWKGFGTFVSGAGSWTWRTLAGAGSGLKPHTFGPGVGVTVGVGLGAPVAVAVGAEGAAAGGERGEI